MYYLLSSAHGSHTQNLSNEKSRRLAAENYSLPERLDHLMRLRKEKLERERSKLAQDVVKEVTVSPGVCKAPLLRYCERIFQVPLSDSLLSFFSQ